MARCSSIKTEIRFHDGECDENADFVVKVTLEHTAEFGCSVNPPKLDKIIEAIGREIDVLD